MRRTVRIMIGICVLGMLMGPGTAYGQNERGEILKVRESVWRAWFANDAKALERLVPPDTIVISSDRGEVEEPGGYFADGGGISSGWREIAAAGIPTHGDSEVWRRGDYLDIVSGRDGRKRKARGGFRASDGDFREANGEWVNPGWHTDSFKVKWRLF